jgi:hypothetical protein
MAQSVGSWRIISSCRRTQGGALWARFFSILIVTYDCRSIRCGCTVSLSISVMAFEGATVIAMLRSNRGQSDQSESAGAGNMNENGCPSIRAFLMDERQVASKLRRLRADRRRRAVDDKCHTYDTPP